jgi:hypothetical protein
MDDKHTLMLTRGIYIGLLIEAEAAVLVALYVHLFW